MAGLYQRPARSVATSGNYAYIAAGSLHVIDISNPASPRRVGGYDFRGRGSLCRWRGDLGQLRLRHGGQSALDGPLRLG